MDGIGRNFLLSRHRTALASIVFVLAGCTSPGTSHSDPSPGAVGSSAASHSLPIETPSVDLEHPVGIIAVGHSGLTGQGAGASEEAQADASWATGTLPEVNSIYRRLTSVVPETEGHVSNNARGGAEASALTSQVLSALARVPAPRLAIVQSLDNDLRCEPTNLGEVGASMSEALETVHAASPNTVLLVLKQPGRPTAELVEQILKADPNQASGLTSGDPCSFLDPKGNIRPFGIQKMNEAIDAYEAEMARVCGRIPNCFTDDGIGRGWVDELGLLSSDYVHYNVAGQAKEAAVMWPRVAEILGL